MIFVYYRRTNDLFFIDNWGIDACSVGFWEFAAGIREVSVLGIVGDTRRDLAELGRPIDVLKSAILFVTGTCVSIVRAFKDMTLWAICASVAISHLRKLAADRRIWIHLHVWISAWIVGTIPALKVNASRGSMCCGVVREIAGVSD